MYLRVIEYLTFRKSATLMAFVFILLCIQIALFRTSDPLKYITQRLNLNLERISQNKTSLFKYLEINGVPSSDEKAKSIFSTYLRDKGAYLLLTVKGAPVFWNHEGLDFEKIQSQTKGLDFQIQSMEHLTYIVERKNWGDLEAVYIVLMNDGSDLLPTTSDFWWKPVSVIFSRYKNGLYPVKYQGQTIGTLSETSNKASILITPISLSIFAILLILFGLLMYRCSVQSTKKLNPVYSVCFLLLGLCFIKVFLDMSQIWDWIDNSTFNGGNVDSISVLGQTLIIVFIFLTVLFFFHKYLPIETFKIESKSIRWVVGLANYFTIMSGMLMIVQFCAIVVIKSKVGLNILNVFSFRLVDHAYILSLMGLFCAFFLLTNRVYETVKKLNLTQIERLGGIFTAIMISLPMFNWIDANISLVAIMLTAIVYLVLFDIFIESDKYKFSWLTIWLAICALFGTALLYKFNLDEDAKNRQTYFDKLSQSTDTTLVTQYNDLINIVRGKTNYTKDQIISKLNDQHYINTNYEFLSIKEDVVSQDKISTFSSNNGMVSLGHLNWVECHGWMKHHFISVTSLEGDGFYKVIHTEFAPRQFINKKVGALLNLSDRDFYQVAVYDKDKLVFSTMPTNQLTSINPLKLKNPTSIGSRLFYAHSLSKDCHAILIQPAFGLERALSLFSYLYINLLLIVILLGVFNTRYSILQLPIKFNFSGSISLMHKIQYSVLSIIVITFLVLAGVSYVLQKRSIKSTKLIEGQLIVNAWQQYLNSNEMKDDDQILSGFLKLNPLVSSVLYNHIGKKLLPDLGNLQDSRMAWEDYSSVVSNKEIERFVTLDYKGKILGFASTGMSGYEIVSKENLLKYKNALLNLFVLLLLLSTFVSTAVASYVTKPILSLGQRLQTLKLGKKNQMMEWKYDDEIGLLVARYNELTLKLEESVVMLAQNERESAWREMAKQVAHEIKNPLTPMKLSIQHLEYATQKADKEQIVDMVKRAGNTLVEQIDALNRIATEFSNFAQMPQGNPEKIILNEIVTNVHDLFRKRDDIDFYLSVPIDDINVFADKGHILRVLNNLVKNAMQSIPESKRGRIEMTLSKESNKAIVIVKDNGCGIEDSMLEKVFFPNFTTKSSGTGLGLAISRDIAESFGGSLYFRTILHVGTEFYFELPSHYKQNELELVEARDYTA